MLNERAEPDLFFCSAILSLSLVIVVLVNVQLYAEHQTTFSLHLAFVLETWRAHGIGICLIVYR